MPAPSIRELFDAAFELPRAQWQVYLANATSDEAVRLQVLRLLEAASEETDFLNRPTIIMPDAASVQAGRRLGPYLIEAEIGRGGMGVVYRATRADDAFHKTVAIKAVSLGVPADSFRRERQILANLEHPNIARMLDGGATEDGVLYLVMELIDGERLDAYADRLQLSIKDRIRLLLPVCEAVSYAHRNLVVHRDLKPANILVMPDGTPKLLDFGVAKVFTPGAGSGDETKTLAMTIDYASPEQIRGESVTTVSDVYSLGVVAYELLTGGKRPYRTTSEDSATARMRAILEDEPLRPQNLGSELGNILMKALAKEPALRYPSVEQFRADLVAHLEGRPVWAQAGGYWYRARKTLRRHWLPIGAAAAVLVTSTVGAVAFLQQARVAEDRRRAAEAASQRAQSLLVDKEHLLTRQDSLLKEQVRLRDQAQAEAKIAQEQRGIAESRFQRSQRLANSLLYEVHDSVNNMQGSAAKRSRIIQQTLPELEGLLREAPEDVGARRSVAAAYERLGDLAGGVRGEGTQGSAAGLQYYSKALALIRKDFGLEPLRRTIVLLKTGALEFRNGRHPIAEQLLAEAMQTLNQSKNRDDAEFLAVEMELLYNACQTRTVAGHPQAAATCKTAENKMQSATTAVLSSLDARKQRMEAFFQLALGAHGRKELANALRLIRSGLEVSTSLVQEFPDRTDFKRTHGMMLVQQANWIRTIGGKDAVEAYAEALKICRVVREADPKHSALGLNHAAAAMQYAKALHKVNREAEGRQAAKESIEVFEELLSVKKPGWEEYNNYAQELLNCPYADLCDVKKALRFTETASRLPGGLNVFLQDTLATAHFRNGEIEKAVEAARKAKTMAAMMPSKAMRDEVDAHLRQYEAALAKQ